MTSTLIVLVVVGAAFLLLVGMTVGIFNKLVTYKNRYKNGFAQIEVHPNEMVSFGLWAGSALATLPLIAVVFYRWNTAQDFSLYDELALIGVTILMVATGVVLRIKASTLFGGGTLVVYLCVLTVSIIYQPQVAIGIYLTAGGGLLFAAGLALAFYRDHLLALPDQFANRQGVFGVISWR